METLLFVITEVLDPISIVVGLIISIPVFWTWYQVVWGESRRYRQYLQAIRAAPGQRPAVLVIDLLPGRNVRAAVENHCQQHETLRQVLPERYFCVEQDGLLANQMQAFQQQVRRVIGEMYAQGVDRIHYFHAGPAMAAAIVGAELANGCPVRLYHWEAGSYQDFGLLKLPFAASAVGG